MIKLRIVLIFILCNMSCKSTKTNINKLKVQYEKIEFNNEMFLIRTSDVSILNNSLIGCLSDAESNQIDENVEIDSFKINRTIQQRGLKLNHLKKFLKDEFYLECKMVFDIEGKAVLSNILDTNLKLSSDDEFEILYRLLQTKASEGKEVYACMKLRFENSKN